MQIIDILSCKGFIINIKMKTLNKINFKDIIHIVVNKIQ